MTHDRPVALITGAGRGIGRATALALAGAGYDVAVNFNRGAAAAQATAEELEALGAKTLLVCADVADEPAVRRMADEIRVQFGRLDALVNNANATTDTPPSDLDGLSIDEWERIFAVNVQGTFQVTRACVPLLREAPSAAVVNVASVAGTRWRLQPIPWAASKAAVVNLTRTLAGALGPGVRVNAVAAGSIKGAWMESVLRERSEVLLSRRAQRTPVRRDVTPDEVASTILSLITSNLFTTGLTVVINGG